MLSYCGFNFHLPKFSKLFSILDPLLLHDKSQRHLINFSRLLAEVFFDCIEFVGQFGDDLYLSNIENAHP